MGVGDRQTLFTSAARVATANSGVIDLPDDARGVFLTLDITAASGTTPTLDVKIQAYDELSGKYVDIVGAAFAQKTGTGTDNLEIYPGITVTANRQVNSAVPRSIRAVATIGGTTPSFTFSLSANAIR